MTYTIFLVKTGVSIITTLTLFFVSSQAVTAPKMEPIQVVEIIETPVTYRHTGNCKAYEDLITSYDWPDEMAMRICAIESGGNPVAVGDKNTEYVSCGLMQIRTLPGRPDCEMLKDPETNVAYAYELWQRSGFHPWTAYKMIIGN
jgi:hypothetical protein